MKKIAMWGFGAFGQHMLQTILAYWNDEIEITKIYDVKHNELSDLDIRVSDPSAIFEDYNKGLFQAVMISVFREDYFEEILSRLREGSIPLFQLGKEEDFFPANRFDREDAPTITINETGYQFYVFRNLRGVLSWARSSGIMYLFDDTGKMLKEPWDRYLVHDGVGSQYDCPIRMDRQPETIVKMTGNYCILAKRYSNNYWHFTFEAMDCIHLLEEAGFTGKYIISDAPFNKELMLLYGIEEHRILPLNELLTGTVYEFERVYYPNLIGNSRACAAKVLRRYASIMKEKTAFDQRNYPTRLFVKRSGSRRLLDYEEVIEKYGFVTIDPDQLSVEEQIAYFYNADIVLSPHGANLTNSLYMRKGSVLIETLGRDWVFYNLIESLRENEVFYLPIVQGRILYPGWIAIGEPRKDYRIPKINLENAIDTALFIRKSIEMGVQFSETKQ